jgi:hypothetical protein
MNVAGFIFTVMAAMNLVRVGVARRVPGSGRSRKGAFERKDEDKSP